MSRFSASMIALSAMLIGLATTPVKADLDQKDRAEMQQVVEQYIKDNPQVLRDALVSLAAREEAERVKAGVMAVRNDDGDPVMGNPNGSLTVYEFSDYNCGYCKRMFAPIMQMLAKNGDVRMVIKEFPILSQSSVTAAKAGIAAQKQGKFKSFHTEMMTYRGQINDASIMQAAGAAGLDLAQLKQDMDSPETTAIIGRTRSAAAALNINGTPGLVIGDTVIPGAISIEELQTVIDKERSKQG
ncbi:DsbA family protein [Alphaproteobacteria bacterium]|nr:DsbA family protein [Alphaproteobacteria bacterium]